jgi:hypothetical protein
MQSEYNSSPNLGSPISSNNLEPPKKLLEKLSFENPVSTIIGLDVLKITYIVFARVQFYH